MNPDLFPELVGVPEPSASNPNLTPEPKVQDSMYWVDEIQVAVELPMGPPGPEGPAPSFGIDRVMGAPSGVAPEVFLELNDESGIWEFEFLVPMGPSGLDGVSGPPLNIIGRLADFVLLPDSAAVGDAYLAPSEIDPTHGESLWVYGRETLNDGSYKYGWTELPDYQGPAGDTAYAYIGDSPPPDPRVGEIWFHPTAMGYSPHGLRVDGGVQFDVDGGYVWGAEGDVVFGLGGMPSAVVARVEQARLTSTKFVAPGFFVGALPGLTQTQGGLVLGSVGRTTVAAGTLRASDPVGSSDVATKGYVDRVLVGADYVDVSGDTMTGPLTVPLTPTAAGHAASKGYVDAAVVSGNTGITQAQADGRYVNVAGDTMTGQLQVPWPGGTTAAAQVAWVNQAIGGGNVSRVNGLRIQAGSAVGRVNSSGYLTIATTFPIEHTVIVSNGDYGANPSSVRIMSWSGASFTVSGMQPNKLGRVNWIAA